MMKKYLLLLVLSVLCCWTSNAAKDEDVIYIFVAESSDTNRDGARVPARIPMYAEYNPTLSSVLVGFRYNVGDVTVEVESDTLGNVYSDVVDSADGGCVIMLSGASGSYTITFTLESGAEYYGEFEI